MLNGGDGFAVQFLGKYKVPHLFLAQSACMEKLQSLLPKEVKRVDVVQKSK